MRQEVGGPGHVQTSGDDEKQQGRREDGEVDAIHGVSRRSVAGAGGPSHLQLP